METIWSKRRDPSSSLCSASLYASGANAEIVPFPPVRSLWNSWHVRHDRCCGCAITAHRKSATRYVCPDTFEVGGSVLLISVFLVMFLNFLRFKHCHANTASSAIISLLPTHEVLMIACVPVCYVYGHWLPVYALHAAQSLAFLAVVLSRGRGIHEALFDRYQTLRSGTEYTRKQ